MTFIYFMYQTGHYLIVEEQKNIDKTSIMCVRQVEVRHGDMVMRSVVPSRRCLCFTQVIYIFFLTLRRRGYFLL